MTDRGRKRTKIRIATSLIYLTPQDIGEEIDRGFRLMSRRTLRKRKKEGKAGYVARTSYYNSEQKEEDL